LYVTALIPVVMFPITGIMTAKEVAPIYMSPILLLFIGGFLVAMAMQEWNLHKRIALNIISWFGGGVSTLILGFMMATYFLSMWISNTATAVMMVSIGLAVIKNYEEILGESDLAKCFSQGLMISIAHAATIGGMATLVGTPPNMALVRIFSMNFPNLPEISFANWMIMGLPLSFIILFISWACITKILFRNKKIPTLGNQLIIDEKNKLGEIKKEEKIVLLVFVLMALSWIFRRDVNIGDFNLPGWSGLIFPGKKIDDGTVAIFYALLLFMIPSSVKNKNILNREAITKIPWETILLFGGGFALAKGIQVSGLSQQIGEFFSDFASSFPRLVVFSITIGMSFLTELTSNMSSTEMILPILASIAKASDISPLSIMIPATLAASCAFMLPAATAPNAIIFGSRRVKIKDMVKVGVVVNLLSVGVIYLVSIFFVDRII
ncbi:MAG: sodium:dicarboxylate symporter, partial [Halobacteriovoraceae bacterium]|nr:sodium:dicarboxylate symporter [Halobacteriovoraceae bacterium]